MKKILNVSIILLVIVGTVIGCTKKVEAPTIDPEPESTEERCYLRIAEWGTGTSNSGLEYYYVKRYEKICFPS